jgi:hypothetical protein
MRTEFLTDDDQNTLSITPPRPGARRDRISGLG